MRTNSSYVIAYALMILASTLNAQNFKLLKSHEYMQYAESSFDFTELKYNGQIDLEDIDSRYFKLHFNILHQSSTEKISENIIYQQVEVLNQAFNEIQLNDLEIESFVNTYHTNIAVPKFIFCLGINPVSSITYHATQSANWNIQNDIKNVQQGGAEPVNATNTINIWVAKLHDEVTGYAQFPGGPAGIDGIVIDYRFFLDSKNEKFASGKTLVHLMGNYFGLHGLWGRGKCQDDFVYDTPIHNAKNVGCRSNRHISTCHDNLVEMTMNYMDNSDDKCLKIFTEGQVKRMLSFVYDGGARFNIVDYNSDCASTQNFVVSEQIKLIEEIKAIPNPAKEFVTIQIPNQFENISCEIISSTSELIYLNENITHGERIDMSNLSPGIYFIKYKYYDRNRIQQSVSEKIIHIK